MKHFKELFIFIFIFVLFGVFLQGLRTHKRTIDDKMQLTGEKTPHHSNSKKLSINNPRMKTKRKICKRNKRGKIKCKVRRRKKKPRKIITKEQVLKILNDYFKSIQHIPLHIHD